MFFTELPLHERLQDALAKAGFVSPTPIQAAALPVALAGRDLVGTAQTGTGKTAAFVLPILQRLIDVPLETRRTRAVILAPTRELVEQILDVVRELGVHTNVRAVAVYGGVAMQQQTHALRKGVELVIACPGRLLDHIKRRNTDFRQLDFLVMDEADRMLDMGFLPSIQEIIAALPETRQTMLFSATFANRLNSFVQQTLREPARIAVDTAVPAQTVRHTLYQVKGSMKTSMLTTLLHQLAPESDSVLIFTQTRVTANQVAGHLHAAGLHVDVLHAEKTQRARQDTLDRFRAGVFPYLVATDIAARGIDVTSISHVINFDLPQKAEDYLHRIGRTGRMERAGHAISLMTRGDIRAVRDIERMLRKRIEVAQLTESDYQRMEASDPQPVTDALPHPHEGLAPPPHHVASRASLRPLKPHHQDEEHLHHSSMEPSQQADRPECAQPADDDAPKRWERRPRKPAPPYAAAAGPARPAHQGKRYADAAPTRSEQSDKPSGSESPIRPPRPRHERRHRDDGPSPAPKRRERDADAPSTSKRRAYALDNRIPDVDPADAPRPERPAGRKFTGIADAAKYDRRHAGGKRLAGEIPATPRPYGKTASEGSTPAQRAARKKRATARRR